MASFKIKGGTPLKGSIRLGGAKNASFKLMIAASLAEGESRLLNISKIGDVEVTYRTLEALGVKLSRPGDHTIYVKSNGFKTTTIPHFTGEKSRAATLFAGPLLAKKGRATIPLPGGCSLGDRPIGRHLDGLAAMGVEIESTKVGLELTAPHGLRATTYTFEKKSHTGTEALLLAAVMAKGKTVIGNAGLEPEIDDLIGFLNAMGGRVKRVAEGQAIEVEGVSNLHGATWHVMPDRNEAVSYACLGLATGGDVIVENAQSEHLTAFLTMLDQVGGGYEVANYGIRFFRNGPLKAVDLTTAPEPGFMTDWQPLFTTMLTQAEGVSHVVEAVHNNRLAFTKELNKMGAKIKLYDPQPKNPKQLYQFDWPEKEFNYHAARIEGPTALTGTRLSVPDLRGGATLVMAAIIASGDSIIEGIEHIDRGYEHFDDRLRALSARIERID